MQDLFSGHTLDQASETDKDDWAEKEHRKSQTPALDKAESQTRKSHADTEEYLAVLLSNARLDDAAFCLNA